MANYEVPFEDILGIFEGVIANTDLDRYITIEVLSDNKQKTVTKLKKNDNYAKYKTGVDVVIFINEIILEQLEEVHQLLIAEEAVSGISFNPEKDKLEVKQPNVKTFDGVLEKFGYPMYNVVQESIKTLYQVQKENAQ